MDSQADQLVKRYPCHAEEAISTFSTLQGVTTEFHINADNSPDFWNDYCTLAQEDEDQRNPNKPLVRFHNLNIGEQLPERSTPIVVPHFFKFTLKSGDEGDDLDDLISKKFITALAYSYQRVIVNMFNVGPDLRELIVAVKTTGIWTCKRVVCCIIELHFPYCRIGRSILSSRFKIAAMEELRHNNVTGMLDVQPDENWDEIIQDLGEYLPLYYSSSDKSIPPLQLKYIFRHLHSTRDTKAETGLSEVFNPKDHSYIRSGKISDDFLDDGYVSEKASMKSKSKKSEVSPQNKEDGDKSGEGTPESQSRKSSSERIQSLDKRKKERANSQNSQEENEEDDNEGDHSDHTVKSAKSENPRKTRRDSGSGGSESDESTTSEGSNRIKVKQGRVKIGGARERSNSRSEEESGSDSNTSRKSNIRIRRRGDKDKLEKDSGNKKETITPLSSSEGGTSTESREDRKHGSTRSTNSSKRSKDKKKDKDKKVSSDSLRKWLPLFFSAYFWDKTTTLKSNERGSGKRLKIEQLDGDDDYEQDAEEDDIENPMRLARIFLRIISDDTLEKDYHWLDVGRVLYNLTDNTDYESDLGLKMFMEQSRRCNQEARTGYQRDEETCRRMWDNGDLAGTPLSVKTLAWMARMDNPTDYNDWHSVWLGGAVDIATTEMADLDIADVVYRYFWLEFTCPDMKNWWFYPKHSHCFIPSDHAVHLRKGMTKNVIPALEKIRSKMGLQQAQLSNNARYKADKEKLEAKIVKISTLIKKLKTESVRNKVVSLCREKFYSSEFRKFIDKDPMKTAWPNCVVEVCNNKIIIREGKPEDYLTRPGMTKFRGDFSWQHPLIKEYMEYLKQVFVDDEVRHFFIKDTSSYMIGRNLEKMFRIWTGVKGDNSKTMMTKILEAWFGQKCINLPLSAYEESKFGGKSGPNPEMAQMAGAHIAITAEPNQGRDLDSGAIKRTTGQDSGYARNCNENGGSFTMVHKPIFMCNFVPNIPGVDGPTKKRCIFLPFLSKWVDCPPESEEERYKQRLFKMDLNFEKRIPKLAEAMFWVAVQSFDTYIKEGLKAPPIMLKYAEDHWKLNDPYECFIAERLTKIVVEEGTEPTAANSVTTGDIYPQFRSFFRYRHPGSETPSCPQFENQMFQRFGEKVKRRWLGWAIADQVS